MWRIAWLLCQVFFILPYSHAVDGRSSRQADAIRALRARRQRDPLFPSELAGKCVSSVVSGREICYPDLQILDYSCVKKDGDKRRTIPPPMIRHGHIWTMSYLPTSLACRYKALITKFRPGTIGRRQNATTGGPAKPFLVVQYQCNPGHEFLDEAEFLFCRDFNWIQTVPVCVPSDLADITRQRGNPCQTDNGGCSHFCHDLGQGVIRCDCPKGMIMDTIDHRTCKQDNPCSIANGGCSHTCQPPGKQGLPPTCSCPDNFILGSDKKTCFETKDWIVKPMDCPQVPYGHPDCVNQCKHDDECDGDKKCCSNGCAYVCLSPDLVERSLPDVSISPPGPLEVRPGSQLNLTCTGTGFPLPTLTWYQNERKMAQKEGGLGKGDPSLSVSRTIYIKELFGSSTFRCEAVNDFGWKSVVANVTVIGPGSMPQAIKNKVRGTNITLTWKPPSFPNGEIIGYKIYYTSGDPRKSLTNWQTFEGGNVERAVIGNLEPNTRYFFRMQAINERAPGVMSLTFHIRTQVPEVPPQVIIENFDAPHGRVELEPLGSINLTCRALTGTPQPTLTWYREGGVPISEPSDKAPAIDLTLTHVMESTRFECIATNKVGSANASVEVVVTGPGTPPQQIQYRLVDGTNVDLSWGAPAITNGPIIGYVVFYTHGNPDAPLDEWEVEVVERAQSTILRNLRPNSKYHVRIQAFNQLGHGPASPSVTIDIGEPWALPKITLAPRPTAPVPPGSKFNITCRGTGVPLPSITWRKGSDEIVSMPSFLGPGEGVAKVLVIERIFETTSFTCEATNSAGTVTDELEIIVRGPGSPPENVQATADRQTIAVTWDEPEYPNGEIQGYYLYFIESVNDARPFTSWKRVLIDDGQTFDWKLSNLKAHTQYTMRMSAYTRDRDGRPMEGVISEKIHARTSRDGEPPTIVLSPSARLIQIPPGGRIRINCTALGTPEPNVKWYKNGKLMGPDVNQELPAGSLLSSVPLIIENVVETSQFECRAVNALGTANAGIRVDVLGPGSAPREIYPTVYSNTVDIQWQEPIYRNGKITGYEICYTTEPTSSVQHWPKIYVPGPVDHFKLNDLLPNTNYTYMVRAFNEHGPGPWSKPQSVITGDYEKRPKVTIVPSVDVHRARIGSTVNLTCIAEGYPPPTVTWHMASVAHDPRFVPEAQEVSISLDNVREPFSIECIGTNPLGQDRKTIRVQVFGLGNAPIKLEGASKGTTAHIRWEPPEVIEADIKHYLIYYTRQAEKSEDEWQIISVPLRLPEEPQYYYWDVADLEPHTMYTFKVRTYTEEGLGPFSDPISINTTERWFMQMEMHPEITAEVPIGGGIDLLCRAKGIPAPMLTWKVNGRVVAEPQPYVSLLRLDPLNELATVTCVAESEWETMDRTVRLVPSDRWQTSAVPTSWPDEEDGKLVIDWTDLLVNAEAGTMYSIYYTTDPNTPLDERPFVQTTHPLNMRLPNITEDRTYYLRIRIAPPDKEWSIITAPTEVVTPKFPTEVKIVLEDDSIKVRWDDVKIPGTVITGYTILYTDDKNRPFKEWFVEEIPDGSAREVPVPNIHSDKPYFVKMFILTDRRERFPTAVYKVRSPVFDRCSLAKCEHSCVIFEEEFDVQCSCRPGFELKEDGKTCSSTTALPPAPMYPIAADEICLEPPDPGTCNQESVEYSYYNSTLMKCMTFVYGGCGGNENRFSDSDECMERCSTKPCLEQRRRTANLPEEQRPKCDSEGDFEPVQVDHTKGQYYCVHPITGEEIDVSRLNTTYIDGKPICRSCELKRTYYFMATPGPAGPTPPDCNEDGTYNTTQCDNASGQCWCVDSITGEERSGTRTSGGVKPDCDATGGPTKPKNWRVYVTDDKDWYYGAWNPVGNTTAKEYIVYFTTKPNQPLNKWYVVVLKETQPPVKLVVHKFLPPNATTTWILQPRFDDGLGEPSDQYVMVPDAPLQPIDLTVEDIGSRTVKLKWFRDPILEPSGLTYTFYVTDMLTQEKHVLNSSDVWDEFMLPVQPDRHYEVYITATNAEGREGPPSPVVNFQSLPEDETTGDSGRDRMIPGTKTTTATHDQSPPLPDHMITPTGGVSSGHVQTGSPSHGEKTTATDLDEVTSTITEIEQTLGTDDKGEIDVSKSTKQIDEESSITAVPIDLSGTTTPEVEGSISTQEDTQTDDHPRTKGPDRDGADRFTLTTTMHDRKTTGPDDEDGTGKGVQTDEPPDVGPSRTIMPEATRTKSPDGEDALTTTEAKPGKTPPDELEPGASTRVPAVPTAIDIILVNETARTRPAGQDHRWDITSTREPPVTDADGHKISSTSSPFDIITTLFTAIMTKFTGAPSIPDDKEILDATTTTPPADGLTDGSMADHTTIGIEPTTTTPPAGEFTDDSMADHTTTGIEPGMDTGAPKVATPGVENATVSKLPTDGSIIEPKASPTPKSCQKIDMPLDLVIILDASNSDGSTDHPLIKNTLKEMLSDYFVVDDEHVAVAFIQYSHIMGVEFGLGRYNNKEAMLDLILKSPHVKGGSRTGDALNAAMELINSHGREDDVPKVVLVISDGHWNGGDISMSAYQLQEAAIYTIAIGIGSKITNEELLAVAGENENRVAMYPTWTEAKVKLPMDVVSKICKFLDDLPKPDDGIAEPTGPTSVPPFKPNISVHHITSDSAVIHWDKPKHWHVPDAVYEISLKDINADSTRRINLSTSDEPKASLVGLIPNTEYSITIRVIGTSIGISPPTEPFIFKTKLSGQMTSTTSETDRGDGHGPDERDQSSTTPAIDGISIAAPTPFKPRILVENIDSNGALIRWDKIDYWHTPDAAYDILLIDIETNTVKKFLSPTSEGNQFRLSELKPDKEYNVAIRIVGHSTGTSPFSETVVFKTQPADDHVTTPGHDISSIAITTVPPFKPMVSVDNVTSDSISIHWDKDEYWHSPNAVYEVSVSNMKTDTVLKTIVPTAEGHHVVLRNLEPDTEYAITIRAIGDAIGTSPVSDILMVKTPPMGGWISTVGPHVPGDMTTTLPPFKPSIKMVNATPDSVVIQWDKDDYWHAPDTAYEILVTNTQTNTVKKIAVPTSDGYQYTLRNLQPDTEYAVAIRATGDSVGTSPISDTVIIRTPAGDGSVPTAGPEIPAGLTSTKAPPFKPTITVKNVSSDSVVLHWDKIDYWHAPETVYEITLKDTETTKKVTVPASVGNQYTVRNLQPDTEYAITIQATGDSIGQSPISDAIVVKTLPASAMVTATGPPVPPFPPVIAVVNITSNSIAIQFDEFDYWNAPDAVYEITVRDTKTNTTRRVSVPPSNGDSVVLRNLSPDTEYAITVQAIGDSVGVSPVSDTVVVKTTIDIGISTIGPEVAPIGSTSVPPFKPTITIKNTTSDSVELHWDKNDYWHAPDAVYEISIKDTSTDTIRKIVVPTAEGHHAIIRNLQPNTEYAISIQAIGDQIGTSPKSDAVIVKTPIATHPRITTTGPQLVPPFKPRITVVNSTSDSVSIQWDKDAYWHAPDAIYEFSVKDTKTNSVEKVEVPTSSGNHYTLRNLKPDTEYAVSIRAIGDSVGTSPVSETLIIKTPPVSPILSSTGLEVIPPDHTTAPPFKPVIRLENIRPNSVIIHWTKPTHWHGPDTVYEISITDTNAGTKRKISVPTSKGHHAAVGNLDPNTDYAITIQAISDTIGTSPISDTIVFKTPVAMAQIATTDGPEGPSPTGAPFNPIITVENITTDSAMIRWEKLDYWHAPDVVYEISLFTTKTGEVVKISVPTSERYHVVLRELRPDTEYEVTLQAVGDSVGESPISDGSVFKTSPIDGDTATIGSATSQAQTPVPFFRPKLEVKNTTSDSVLLQWDPDEVWDAPDTVYQISVTDTIANTTNKITVPTSDGYRYILKNLNPNTEYAIHIQAVSDSIGTSPMSDIILIKTGPADGTMTTSGPQMEPGATTTLGLPPFKPVITIENTTSNSVVLRWDKPDHWHVPDAIYEVSFMDTKTNITHKINVPASEDTPSIMLRNLDPETEYAISIRAIGDTIGTSPVSETLIFKTPKKTTTGPFRTVESDKNLPSGVSITDVKLGEELSWEIDDETRDTTTWEYIIYNAEGIYLQDELPPGVHQAVINDGSARSIELSDDYFPSQNYTFWIRARNEYGDGPLSTAFIATRPSLPFDHTIGTVPSLLPDELVTTTGPDEEPDGFTSPITASQFTISGTPEILITYTGTGPPPDGVTAEPGTVTSDVEIGTIPPELLLPKAPKLTPTITEVDQTSRNEVKLIWTMPHMERLPPDWDFVIYYTWDPTHPRDQWDLKFALPSESTGYTIGRLRPMKSYNICLRARNTYGLGPMSNCVIVTLIDMPARTTPTTTIRTTTAVTPKPKKEPTIAPRITEGKQISPTALMITWTMPDMDKIPDLDFVIYYTPHYTEPADKWGLRYATPKDAPGYTMDKLTPKQKYRIRIRARNQYGLGPFSNAVDVFLNPDMIGVTQTVPGSGVPTVYPGTKRHGDPGARTTVDSEGIPATKITKPSDSGLIIATTVQPDQPGIGTTLSEIPPHGVDTRTTISGLGVPRATLTYKSAPQKFHVEVIEVNPRSAIVRWDRDDEWQPADAVYTFVLTDNATGTTLRLNVPTVSDQHVLSVKPSHSYSLVVISKSDREGVAQVSQPITFTTPPEVTLIATVPPVFPHVDVPPSVPFDYHPVITEIDQISPNEIKVRWVMENIDALPPGWNFEITYSPDQSLPKEHWSKMPASPDQALDGVSIKDLTSQQHYHVCVRLRNSTAIGPSSPCVSIFLTTLPSATKGPGVTTRKRPIGADNITVVTQIVHTQETVTAHPHILEPDEKTTGLDMTRPTASGPIDPSVKMTTPVDSDQDGTAPDETTPQLPFIIVMDKVTPRKATVSWTRNPDSHPPGTLYTFTLTNKASGKSTKFKSTSAWDRYVFAVRPGTTYTLSASAQIPNKVDLDVSNTISFDTPAMVTAGVPQTGSTVVTKPTIPGQTQSTAASAEPGQTLGPTAEPTVTLPDIDYNIQPSITEIEQIADTSIKVWWTIPKPDTVPADTYFTIYYSPDSDQPKETWAKVIARPDEASTGKTIEGLDPDQLYEVCMYPMDKIPADSSVACVPVFLIAFPTPPPFNITRNSTSHGTNKPDIIGSIGNTTIMKTIHKMTTAATVTKERDDEDQNGLTGSPGISTEVPLATTLPGEHWKPRGSSDTPGPMATTATDAAIEKPTGTDGSTVESHMDADANHTTATNRPSSDASIKETDGTMGEEPLTIANGTTETASVSGTNSTAATGTVALDVHTKIPGLTIETVEQTKLSGISPTEAVIGESMGRSRPELSTGGDESSTLSPAIYPDHLSSLGPGMSSIAITGKPTPILGSTQSTLQPSTSTRGRKPKPGGESSERADDKSMRPDGASGMPPDPTSDILYGTSTDIISDFTLGDKSSATEGIMPSLTPVTQEPGALVTPIPDAASTPAYQEFTLSIPADSITVAPACNCTCDTAPNQRRRCYFDNETAPGEPEVKFYRRPADGKLMVKIGEREMEVPEKECDKDKDKGKESSSSGEEEKDEWSFILTTPVPSEMEEDCPCVKPLRADQCPPGYSLWKGRCRDINECDYKNGDCSHGCVNTAGGFYCACPPGMARDPSDPFKCLSEDALFKRMAQSMYFHMWQNVANRPGVTMKPVADREKVLEQFQPGKGRAKALIGNGTNMYALEWQWSEMMRKMRL